MRKTQLSKCRKHAKISSTKSYVKFRCQFPVSAVLAHKIPLRRSSSISRQVTDLVVIFGYEGRFQDDEKAHFPALREYTAIRRRRGGGAGGAIRRPAGGCRDRSS